MTLLTLSGITKRYPGVTALAGVDLDIDAGSVHALVGENGAGKSTLLKIVAGAERADAGVMAWNGQPVSVPSPREALLRGVTVIYQELTLAPNLSAAANIYLGMEPRRGGFLDRGAMRAGAASALADLGLVIDPDQPVGELSVAQRQLVELARALVRDARLVALDEPTATLTAHEVAHLVAQIEWLRAKGIAVVFVSHRLDEIRRLADSITVLRDGHRVWTGPAEQIDERTLIRTMVGRDVVFERCPPGREPESGAILSVRGLSRGRSIQNVSFDVRQGEILGLGGLVGAGRSEVARVLAGIDRPEQGSVSLRGVPFNPRSPADAIRAGVVYFPEDRKRQGLVLGMRIRENVTLPVLGRVSRNGLLQGDAERALAQGAASRADVRPPDIERQAGTLSGGNQQKVVLAKWLLTEADVLIFDEPTRGVDIGAKTEIHRQIRALADLGKAVIVISSELPELIALADRAVVMREGRVQGEIANALTPEAVMALAFRSA
ncbi:MAG TPA: sugar ABC transporter ATP-binding protein [Gemmatimonadales bacterium]|nr:sugar ABC transporter ATP-binding protein [Gemmatimonadales bacterium]